MAMIMGKQHESDAFTGYQRCWRLGSFPGACLTLIAILYLCTRDL